MSWAFPRPTRRIGAEWSTCCGRSSPDGSWHVASRAPKFQPYFQSGFPHDHDQWISSAATAWGAIALSYAAADGRAERRRSKRIQKSEFRIQEEDGAWRRHFILTSGF